MKLEIYGDKSTGFSAHGAHIPLEDAALYPCPFCGSNEIAVENTHTASYSAECQKCEAQVSGPWHFGNRIKSRAQCRRVHQKAFDSAVQRWNTRAA